MARWPGKKSGKKAPRVPKPAAAPSRLPARQAPTPAPKTYDWRSYDEVAHDYARTHAPYTTRVAADLLEFGEAQEGSRVLDVGTGTADAVPVGAARVGASGLMVGVDPAYGMLKVAANPRTAAAEAANLPFRDAIFDVVLLNFSLAYFAKLDSALAEIKRVLKPKGVVAVSCWGSDEDELTKTWRTMVEETLGRDILKAGLKDESPWAALLSEPKRLEAALRDAGLRPVTVERRRYRVEIDREDYVRGHEIEAAGRYTRAMLGERLWPSFQQRVRAAFAERFPETLVDFRDVLLARAGRP